MRVYLYVLWLVFVAAPVCWVAAIEITVRMPKPFSSLAVLGTIMSLLFGLLGALGFKLLKLKLVRRADGQFVLVTKPWRANADSM